MFDRDIPRHTRWHSEGLGRGGLSGLIFKLLLVAGGGGIGAAARFLVGEWMQTLFKAGFPWGTFIANVSGSFLIGIVLAFFEANVVSPGARLFLAVGILGGYTTFSTFSYETLGLLTKGQLGLTLLYVLGQVTLSLAAVYAGVYIARSLV